MPGPEASLVKTWVEKNQPFIYKYQTLAPTVSIPANTDNKKLYEVKAEKGVVLSSHWIFDHPYCGIRITANDLDMGQDLTVAFLMSVSGAYTPSDLCPTKSFVTGPEYSFSINLQLPFTGVYSVYAINIDKLYDHKCLTYYVLWAEEEKARIL